MKRGFTCGGMGCNVEVKIDFLTLHASLEWTLNNCSWRGHTLFPFEDVNCTFPWGLGGISAQLLVAPNALIIYNSFTTTNHNLCLLIALVPKHGVAKKCRFNLSVLPHKFSQHGCLYLGWHLPITNVNCTFNGSSISTIFYAHYFEEY